MNGGLKYVLKSNEQSKRMLADVGDYVLNQVKKFHLSHFISCFEG